MQVLRGVSRLGTGRGIGLAAAPSASIERDDAIARFRECLDLRFPDLARSCVRVQQDDRLTAPARIGEPQTNAGERRQVALRSCGFLSCTLLSRDRDRCRGYDEDRKP